MTSDFDVQTLTRFHRVVPVGRMALLLFATAGCVVSRGVVTRSIAVAHDSARATSDPAKAQLMDGSIVSFPRGYRVERDRIVGNGVRYLAEISDSVHVTSVAVDSVAAIVGFRTTYDPAKTVGFSLAAAVITGFLVILAVIGLCITRPAECFR